MDRQQVRNQLTSGVNALIGYAELLLEDADAGLPADRLEALIKAGRRIQRGIRRLLRASTLARDSVDELDLKAVAQKAEHYLTEPIQDVVGELEQLESHTGSASESAARDLRRIRDSVAELQHIVGALTSQAEPTGAHQSATDAVAQAVVGKVLVVDDSESGRDELLRELTAAGHSVAAVASGPDALVALATRPFDVVLLDVRMPGLTGYETLAQLRAEPALTSIPIIMLAAIDDVEEAVRCIEAGATDFLTKPVNPTLLRTRLAPYLKPIEP